VYKQFFDDTLGSIMVAVQIVPVKVEVQLTPSQPPPHDQVTMCLYSIRCTSTRGP
jgi:hypothetical protein